MCRRDIPFLSIHCGPSTGRSTVGRVSVVQLKRGPASFGLDANLDCDPFLIRYFDRVVRALREFGAELIHITGPGDMGMLGLHEYAGRRVEQLLSKCGPELRRGVGHTAEKVSMGILTRFYRRASAILAPNLELVDMLKQLTGHPVFLMQRGVDTELFTPARRTRHDSVFRIGYVGRLTTEKNVRFLADLSSSLRATDTFGNVVLEALSSAVPAVVTDEGGPKFLVHSGVTGFVAANDWDFTRYVNALMTDLDMHSRMREGARHYACSQSWDTVFEAVFRAYNVCLPAHQNGVAQPPALLSSRMHGRPGS